MYLSLHLKARTLHPLRSFWAWCPIPISHLILPTPIHSPCLWTQAPSFELGPRLLHPVRRALPLLSTATISVQMEFEFEIEFGVCHKKAKSILDWASYKAVRTNDAELFRISTGVG
jgi:hypothetical protein